MLLPYLYGTCLRIKSLLEVHSAYSQYFTVCFANKVVCWHHFEDIHGAFQLLSNSNICLSLSKLHHHLSSTWQLNSLSYLFSVNWLAQNFSILYILPIPWRAEAYYSDLVCTLKRSKVSWRTGMFSPYKNLPFLQGRGKIQRYLVGLSEVSSLSNPTEIYSVYHRKIKGLCFCFVLLAAVGLHCCPGFSLLVASEGYWLAALLGFLLLQSMDFSSCGLRPQ